MMASNPEEIAKLHCLYSLFSSETVIDQYLLNTIKEAIEYHLREQQQNKASVMAFADAAFNIFRNQKLPPPSYRIYHLDFRDDCFDPLWAHEKIIQAMKRLSGYQDAFLLISGIRSALHPSGKYWTRRKQKDYANAISYIDQLVADWTTPSTHLTILYL